MNAFISLFNLAFLLICASTDTVAFTDDFDEDMGGTVPCTCGAFLDDQLTRSSLRPDQENNPVFSYPLDDEGALPGGSRGRKLCTKKCVELALKYANQSHDLLCAAVDRDIYRQKVHLFIKNHDDKWYNTKLNSGREFSCKDGLPA